MPARSGTTLLRYSCYLYVVVVVRAVLYVRFAQQRNSTARTCCANVKRVVFTPQNPVTSAERNSQPRKRTVNTGAQRTYYTHSQTYSEGFARMRVVIFALVWLLVGWLVGWLDSHTSGEERRP